MSTLRIDVESEPRSKKSRGRVAADHQLEEWMLRNGLPWNGLNGAYGTRWPRLQAPLAVDISFSPTERNPPEIHTATKWLLDVLGSQEGQAVVFRDDRQVKMLFARMFRDSDRPLVSVTAQTLSHTLAGVRRSISLDHPWRPDKASYAIRQETDSDPADEDLSSWYEDDPSDFGQEWHLRLTLEERLRRQSYLLALTDQLSARVVTAYASERVTRSFGLPGTSDALSRLVTSPLAVNLGQLPTRGQSKIFKTAVTAQLASLADSRPDLFPLLSATGLTLFYVEGGDGKDLDNIFLDLLPLAFKFLQPPKREINPWAPLEEIKTWDAALRDQRPLAAPGVTFIEAIALQNVTDMAFAPGTTIMALSHGARYESWWSSAISSLADGLKESDEFDD